MSLSLNEVVLEQSILARRDPVVARSPVVRGGRFLKRRDNLFDSSEGNQDIVSFPFGITLDEGDLCVHVQHESLDRHHVVTREPVATPAAPCSLIDLHLVPFNRGDSYEVKLYIVTPEARADPGTIEVGSPHPVRFVDMPTLAESVAEVAGGIAINIAGVRLSVQPSRWLR